VLRAGQWVPRPAPIGLQSLVDEAIANAVANGYDVLAGDLRSVAVDIMDHAPAVQEMVESGALPGDDVGVGMVAAAVLRARMESTGWRREKVKAEAQAEHSQKLLRDAEGIRDDLYRQLDEAEGVAAQLAGDRDEARRRVQEIEAQLAKLGGERKVVPHATAQSVLNAGINVFGLQLVLESLAKADEGAITFNFSHRGRRWRVTFDSTIGAAAGEESQP
jgi:broad-specificity NMP kinase